MDPYRSVWHSSRLVDMAMLAVTLAAGSVGVWMWIRSLEYLVREALLVYFAIILVLYPLVIFLLPRWLTWVYWTVPAFGIAIGLAYCGDLGEYGHYFAAGFTLTAALFAIALGAVFLHVIRRSTKNTVTEFASGESRSNQLAGRYWPRAVLLLLLVASVAWATTSVSSEIHLSVERRQMGAPFINAGLLISWSAAGEVSIQCENTQFDDADLGAIQEELEGLANLRILNLSFSRVTDVGLVHLRRLTSLESVSLFRTAVTDVGILKLKDLAGLQWLDVRETKVSADGVAELQKHLEDCFIEF